jgi:hypothetical protein
MRVLLRIFVFPQLTAFCSNQSVERIDDKGDVGALGISHGSLDRTDQYSSATRSASDGSTEGLAERLRIRPHDDADHTISAQMASQAIRLSVGVRARRAFRVYKKTPACFLEIRDVRVR